MTRETVLLYDNIILLLLLRLSMRFLIIFSPCCTVDTVYYRVRKQPAILFIIYSAVFTASVRSICHSRPAAAACKHPFEAASNRFVPSATGPHAKKRFVCPFVLVGGCAVCVQLRVIFYRPKNMCRVHRRIVIYMWRAKGDVVHCRGDVFGGMCRKGEGGDRRIIFTSFDVVVYHKSIAQTHDGSRACSIPIHIDNIPIYELYFLAEYIGAVVFTIQTQI